MILEKSVIFHPATVSPEGYLESMKGLKMRIKGEGNRRKVLLGMLLAVAAGARAEDSAWVSILPKTAALEDWTIKFTGKPVGQNPDTTFRLSPEGHLWANNHTAFSRTGFGHIYYTKRKLSYYMVRAEYSFPQENSASGFAAWTKQNNGLMIHSPDPATVTGEFPNSIEVQLLGPKNTNESGVVPSATWPVGKTANMCIAGDAFYVNYNGNNTYTTHCTPANYPDAWKGTRIPWEGEWSDVMVRTLADSVVEHYIRGQKVFTSTKIRMKSSGTPVKDGYLAIQAEGTPTLFRKLDILDLEGCMDNTKAAYRTYFVKSKAGACETTGLGTIPNSLPKNVSMAREAEGFSFRSSESGTLEVADPAGRILVRKVVAAGVPQSLKLSRKGLSLVTWKSAGTAARIKWTSL